MYNIKQHVNKDKFDPSDAHVVPIYIEQITGYDSAYTPSYKEIKQDIGCKIGIRHIGNDIIIMICEIYIAQTNRWINLHKRYCEICKHDSYDSDSIPYNPCVHIRHFIMTQYDKYTDDNVRYVFIIKLNELFECAVSDYNFVVAK